MLKRLGNFPSQPFFQHISCRLRCVYKKRLVKWGRWNFWMWSSYFITINTIAIHFSFFWRFCQVTTNQETRQLRQPSRLPSDQATLAPIWVSLSKSQVIFKLTNLRPISSVFFSLLFQRTVNMYVLPI